MTETRRFDEDEVQAIFERATQVEPVRVPSRLAAPSANGRLSLTEIQTIGLEAGIDAGRIAEAAATLTRFGHDRAVKRQLGVAITASARVELPRILSDREWDHLVVRLREAFGGPGAVRVEGSLRIWTHTHTQVLLEPTPLGARLRMTSLDWGAKQWLDGGAVGAIIGGGVTGLLGVMAVLGGKLSAFLVPMGLFGGMAVLGLGSWTIGRWIANRRMPQLQARLEALGASALREAQTDSDAGRIPPSTS